MSVRPPVEADLRWESGLRFRGRAGTHDMVLDGDGEAGLTPVQTLALSLAGCMAIDVVHILEKGRTPVAGLHARLSARRAEEDPRRLTEVELRFTVSGEVPAEKVERALALSRDKYCSVWHSLRPDIAFRTTFEIAPTRS